MHESIYNGLPEPPDPDRVLTRSVKVDYEPSGVGLSRNSPPRHCQHCDGEIDPRERYTRAHFRLDTDDAYPDGTRKTRSYRLLFCDEDCWQAWVAAAEDGPD